MIQVQFLKDNKAFNTPQEVDTLAKALLLENRDATAKRLHIKGNTYEYTIPYEAEYVVGALSSHVTTKGRLREWAIFGYAKTLRQKHVSCLLRADLKRDFETLAERMDTDFSQVSLSPYMLTMPYYHGNGAVGGLSDEFETMLELPTYPRFDRSPYTLTEYVEIRESVFKSNPDVFTKGAFERGLFSG